METLCKLSAVMGVKISWVCLDDCDLIFATEYADQTLPIQQHIVWAEDLQLVVLSSDTV